VIHPHIAHQLARHRLAEQLAAAEERRRAPRARSIRERASLRLALPRLLRRRASVTFPA